MIVCKKCGHRNEENDVFCGSCGEYLEWAGQKVEEAPPSPSPPPPTPHAPEEPDAPGLIQRVKSKIGLEDESSAPIVTPPPQATPPPPVKSAPKRAEPALPDPNATVLMPRIDVSPPKSVNLPAPAARDPEATQAMPAVSPDDPPPRLARKMPAVPPPPDPQTKMAGSIAPPREPDSAKEVSNAHPPVSEPAEPAPDPQELERLRREQEWKERLEREDRERLAEEEKARLAAAEKSRLEQEERRKKAAALRAKPPSAASPAPVFPPPPVPPVTPVAPVVPPRPPAPASESPGARQPAAVAPARPHVPKAPITEPPPPESPKEGDLICGNCGTGNGPERRFCKRCGNSLKEAAVVAAKRIPWWRRLFSRKEQVHTAGERPMRGRRRNSGGTVGRTLRILSLIVLLGGGAIAVGPGRSFVSERSKDLVERIRGLFPTEVSPVHPVRAEASSQLSDHPSMHAIDRGTNTYWCEGIPGNGEHQSINLIFEPPADIDVIRVSSGAPGKDFLLQPRPKDLLLTFSDGSTQTLTLKDQNEFQEFDVTGKATANVRIEILSVYAGTGGQNTSITELEFFDKS